MSHEYIPTYEHINEYRKRMGLEPYPSEPVRADKRIRDALDAISRVDTVTLLTPKEVLDIIHRALNGEFESPAPEEKC